MNSYEPAIQRTLFTGEEIAGALARLAATIAGNPSRCSVC